MPTAIEIAPKIAPAVLYPKEQANAPKPAAGGVSHCLARFSVSLPGKLGVFPTSAVDCPV
jgi:hypothetical protein